MGRDSDILVGLDLGTTKITVAVAERVPERPDEAQIIGIGEAPARNGLRKGMIVNLTQAVNSISDAIADAESSLRGLKISRVAVSFSGQDVRCRLLHGKISLGRNARRITRDDLNEVIDNALSELQLKPEVTCLHAIPIKYAVDGNSGISDPIEMTGIKLEVDLAAVVLPATVVRNVVNCVEKAGVKVSGLIVKPLAEALGTLSRDDREIGASLISVGGGTTSVTVFSDGHLLHAAEIPVGGDHITNDIMQIMKIPLQVAEDIKKQIDISPDSVMTGRISIENRGRKQELEKGDIAEIVSLRLEELFTDAVLPSLNAVKKAGLPTEVIMTGGVMLSPGINEFAEHYLNMPVRTGAPVLKHEMQRGRNDCRYSAVCGVIVYLAEKKSNPFAYIETPVAEYKSGADEKAKFTWRREKKMPRHRRESESVKKNVALGLKELFRQLF